MVTSRAHVGEWLIGLAALVVLFLLTAPAWADAILAVALACGWCYALERSTKEVTE